MELLIQQLQKHRIPYQEFPYWGTYFIDRWDSTFVHHLSKADKETIFLYSDRYSCGYLWHVFSYRKRPHLTQDAASKAFNSKKKTKCYVFYQHYTDVLVIEQGAALKADHFLHEEDV